MSKESKEKFLRMGSLDSSWILGERTGLFQYHIKDVVLMVDLHGNLLFYDYLLLINYITIE
jgi:hypothetical protein